VNLLLLQKEHLQNIKQDYRRNGCKRSYTRNEITHEPKMHTTQPEQSPGEFNMTSPWDNYKHSLRNNNYYTLFLIFVLWLQVWNLHRIKHDIKTEYNSRCIWNRKPGLQTSLTFFGDSWFQNHQKMYTDAFASKSNEGIWYHNHNSYSKIQI